MSKQMTKMAAMVVVCIFTLTGFSGMATAKDLTAEQITAAVVAALNQGKVSVTVKAEPSTAADLLKEDQAKRKMDALKARAAKLELYVYTAKDLFTANVEATTIATSEGVTETDTNKLMSGLLTDVNGAISKAIALLDSGAQINQMQIDRIENSLDLVASLLNNIVGNKLKNNHQDAINGEKVSFADLERMAEWYEGTGPQSINVVFTQEELKSQFLKLENGVIFAAYTYQSKLWKGKSRGPNVCYLLIPDKKNPRRSYVLKTVGYNELSDIAKIDAQSGDVTVNFHIGSIENSMAANEVFDYFDAQAGGCILEMFKMQNCLKVTAQKASAAAEGAK